MRGISDSATVTLNVNGAQAKQMTADIEGVNRALDNIELATPRELYKTLRTLNRQRP